MARLPNVTRFVPEEFKEQRNWITPLLQSLNSFFETLYSALNRNLTLKENLAADVIVAEVDGVFPMRLAWSLKSRPIAVLVGDISKSDGGTVSLSGAPGVKWSFNHQGQLQIDAVQGPTVPPAAATKYKLVLLCFTG